MVKTLPSNAVGEGLIPGLGAKIPHASWPKKQNIKQKQYCNKFNNDFKNGSHQKKILKKKNLLAQWRLYIHKISLGIWAWLNKELLKLKTDGIHWLVWLFRLRISYAEMKVVWLLWLVGRTYFGEITNGLAQRSPKFLEPETYFVEKLFFRGWGRRWFGDDSSTLHLLCTLFLLLLHCNT